jgi:hypothetical protein
MTRKNYILLIALLVTLWLTWRSHEQSKGIEVSAPTRTSPVNLSPNSVKSINQLRLITRTIAPSQVNLFDTPPQSLPDKVLALKPVKETIVKVVKPIAPPLPFKYLGRIQTESGNGVMLDVQGEVTPIKQGDVLQGQYKVQAIVESVAGLQIQFLYIPLNQTQTLYAQVVR